MNIEGQITGIKYRVLQLNELQSVDFNKFNINDVSPSCLLKDGETTFAVSKWVSPKRTRSYPYERVYNLENNLSPENSVFIDALFKEAEANNFTVKICYAK